MKMKMVFVGLLVALFALNALPVQATDFSGHVKATSMVDWQWRDGVGIYAKYQTVAPESGKIEKRIQHFYIENIAEFPLTEAVYLIGITQVTFYNASLDPVLVITDPAEIAQVIRLENSDEMWQGNYVIWLGTIRPGHSKRCMFNWWYGELLASWEHSWVISYEYLTWQGVWYLP